jgi:ankyrin repeat protein
MAELLVNSGADVAVQNNRNRTPLQVAENRDLTKIAQLLTTLPPLNKMLWHAVCRGNVKVANLALFKGASPKAMAAQWMLPQGKDTPAEVVDCLNAAIERQDTPLHIAVENRNVEMVKLLLGFGGKINRQNRGGDTPLILAARRPELLMTIFEATVKISAATPEIIPEAIPQANSGRPKLFKRLLACFRAEK